MLFTVSSTTRDSVRLSTIPSILLIIEDTPIRHCKRSVPIRKDDTNIENDKKRLRAT